MTNSCTSQLNEGCYRLKNKNVYRKKGVFRKCFILYIINSFYKLSQYIFH